MYICMKLRQIRDKGDKTCIFKDQFQFILTHRAKMKRKLIFKSPRFLLFGSNLTQHDLKLDIYE